MLKDILKKWLIKKLIPWFMKYVWPEISNVIKIYIIAYGTKLIKCMMEWLKEFFKKQFQNKQTRKEYAQQKYEEAKQRATNAENPQEVDKYKAVAEVWREVFEQFREENEQLKEELKKATEIAEKLSSKVKNDVETDIDHFGVDRIMESKVDRLPEIPNILWKK